MATIKTSKGRGRISAPRKSSKTKTRIIFRDREVSGDSANTNSGGELSITLPSWAPDGFSLSTIPPEGTKIAFVDSSHNPENYIATYDGNTPINENVTYIGKCGDKNIFVYIYNG